MNPSSINNYDTGLNLKGTGDSKQNKELGQKDFMKLLLAQMQSQDPTNPQDNGDFIAQMAQFSQLDGITKLNDSFDKITNQIRSSQALQASALVGRTVQVQSQFGTLDSTKGIEGNLVLPDTARNVSVSMVNSKGEIVKQFELGNFTAGKVPFKWDGTDSAGIRVPQGEYEICAEGIIDGKLTRFPTWVGFNVDSVSLAGGTVSLNLGDHGTVNISQVLEIS